MVMPIKLRPSSRTYTRFSNAYTTEHYYIKTISQKDLFEELNKEYTKPKVKQKIRHELVRRGIKIVKKDNMGS